MSEEWAWEKTHLDAEKYERREACFALVECPRCGVDLELVAETESWTKDDEAGVWLHESYGPAMGVCCGTLFVDSWDGMSAYKLGEGGDAPAEGDEDDDLIEWDAYGEDE